MCSWTSLIVLLVAALAAVQGQDKDIYADDYTITVEEEAIARKSCEKLAEIYIAGFVRTIFHDCVGGCDGCIDLKKPDNAGLDEYMDELEKGWRDDGIYKFMRRSDYWALCSWEAVKAGHKNSELKKRYDILPELTIKYGRPECAPYPAFPNQRSYNKFPRGHGDWAETAAFFRREFGFDGCQTVAILGAHTLGEAKKKNSGFTNEWVKREDHFDHDYYKQMLNASNEWTQVNVGPAADGEDRWQYVHGQGKEFLMLNADMCMAFDIRPVPSGQVADPNPLSSPKSPGFPCTSTFAQSNAVFLRKFAEVFNIMIHTTKPRVYLKPASRTSNPYSKLLPTKNPTKKPTKNPGSSRRPDFLGNVRQKVNKFGLNVGGFWPRK